MAKETQANTPEELALTLRALNSIGNGEGLVKWRDLREIMARLRRLYNVLDHCEPKKTRGAGLIQQIYSYPQLSYNETELNRYIMLNFSRQDIPTSKVIEDEYQQLRYQIRAQKPTVSVRICRVFAFREMVLFHTVKCWVFLNNEIATEEKARKDKEGAVRSSYSCSTHLLLRTHHVSKLPQQPVIERD